MIDEAMYRAGELRQRAFNLFASLGQLQIADAGAVVLARESLATLRLIENQLAQVVVLMIDPPCEETLRAVRAAIARLEQKL